MNASIKVALTLRITRVVYHRAGTYIHYMKDYRSSCLTLVTCDNIAIDYEEGVLENNKLMAEKVYTWPVFIMQLTFYLPCTPLIQFVLYSLQAHCLTIA